MYFSYKSYFYSYCMILFGIGSLFIWYKIGIYRFFFFCRYRDRNNVLYENFGLVFGGFVGGIGRGGFLFVVGGREICNN